MTNECWHWSSRQASSLVGVEVPAILLIFRDCFADILVVFNFDTFVFFFFHLALPPYPDYIGQFVVTQVLLGINSNPQTTQRNVFRGHLKTQPVLSKDVMIKTPASWPFWHRLLSLYQICQGYQTIVRIVGQRFRCLLEGNKIVDWDLWRSEDE